MNKTEEKRQLILHAGERVFSQGRYDESTMEDIAKEAGVGKGTLYRYFASKEELLSQILQSIHDELVHAIHEVSEGEGSFRELLVETCRQIAVSHERRHPMFHKLFALHQQDKTDEKRNAERCEHRRHNCEELLGAIGAVLSRGVATGELRDDISVEGQSVILLNMLTGWGHFRGHQKEVDLTLDMIIDVYCNGVLK